MTNDGYNTLAYDGENRATSATNGNASANYTYDANGWRVQKAVHNGTTTVYVFSGAKAIAEYENGAAPANPTREYIYSGLALMAKIEGSSTMYYQTDHLSTRLMTDGSGNTAGQQGHYPFGENWYAQNTTTKWEFTTYERDAETDPGNGKGNDYAVARDYVDRLGRFSSPDPVGGSSDDPQSLDGYAYVEDDPVNRVDPTGLCPPWGPYISGYDAAHGKDGVYKARCREVMFVLYGVFGLFSRDYHLGTKERGFIGRNISGPVALTQMGNTDPTGDGTPSGQTKPNTTCSLGPGGVALVPVPGFSSNTFRASFDSNGLLNGVSVNLGDRSQGMNMGSHQISFAPNSTVALQWVNGFPLPGSFTVGANPPATISSGLFSSASISSITFNGDGFQTTGSAYFLGIPLGSGPIDNALNSDLSLALKAADLADSLATHPVSCQAMGGTR